MKNYGLMQVGLGCRDITEVKEWYQKNLGFVLDLIDDENEAGLMTKYTGGEIYTRRAIMSFQGTGGAGLEFWQFKSRDPEEIALETEFDSLGILANIIETDNPVLVEKSLKNAGCSNYYPLSKNPILSKIIFLRDPFGNIFGLKQKDEISMRLEGVVLGVSNLKIWQSLLKAFDYVEIENSENTICMQNQGMKNPFQLQYGPSEIILIENKDSARNVYEQRFWGDPGYIHFCFHIDSMEDTISMLEEQGIPITVDSKESFQMSKSKGRFAYIEPESKILVELIEVHKE